MIFYTTSNMTVVPFVIQMLHWHWIGIDLV